MVENETQTFGSITATPEMRWAQQYYTPHIFGDWYIS